MSSLTKRSSVDQNTPVTSFLSIKLCDSPKSILNWKIRVEKKIIAFLYLRTTAINRNTSRKEKEKSIDF